jgi:hypothetical protein
MSLTRCLPFLAPLFFASALLADETKSGPDKGEKVSALKVFAATGEQEGKDVDYIAERKDKPTIYVFVQADKWSRPMNRFLKTLDEAVHKDGDAAIVAVWLTEKPDETKEYLPKLQTAVKYEATALTCFTGEKIGPMGWAINSDAHLTVVVVNKGKVAAAMGFQSINETDVPGVEKALKMAKEEK